jgi:predicted alpha/beta-fold hydrolase
LTYDWLMQILKRYIFFSDNLKIFGDLYLSKMKKSPCILLLHGTNELGRKEPIVLAIAKELQKLKYTVLAIDFRGYNESQDPAKIDSVNDLDFAQDAISAIDYLVKNTVTVHGPKCLL